MKNNFLKIYPIILITFSTILSENSLYATEYTAFSLKVAKERILSTPADKDYRDLHPEVFTLAGINKLTGLVYDRENKDIILVGERDPNRAILTLDDFAVALRARFIHWKWPLVSIDPTPDTKETNMQTVRYEGGIENTQFGQDLFDTDYILKEIAFGLVPPDVKGVESYWDISLAEIKQTMDNISWKGTRFWFYPILPNVIVRDEVAVIKELRVGVFTELLFIGN